MPSFTELEWLKCFSKSRVLESLIAASLDVNWFKLLDAYCKLWLDLLVCCRCQQMFCCMVLQWQGCTSLVFKCSSKYWDRCHFQIYGCQGFWWEILYGRISQVCGASVCSVQEVWPWLTRLTLLGWVLITTSLKLHSISSAYSFKFSANIIA